MANRPEGAIAEVFAALDKKGDIDPERTKEHVDFLMKKGVQGLFVAGVGAEGLTFSNAERISWLKSVIEVAKSNIPTIFNVTTINLSEGKTLIKEAADIGVDVISITQPVPVAFPEKEIMTYFDRLCVATDKPMMLYNESGIGNPLKIDTLKKVFRNHENLVYYKDSTHNLIDLHTLLSIDDPPKVFAGSDGLIYDIISSGGSGIISLVIDVFPALITEIVESLDSGNYSGALEQQRFILKVRSVLKKGGLTAGYRYASELIGMTIGEPRAPYYTMGEEDKKVIYEGLRNLGLIR